MAGHYPPHNFLGEAGTLGPRGSSAGKGGYLGEVTGPGGVVVHPVRPPASKSQAQRVLLLAAVTARFARETTHLAGLQGPEADGRYAAGDDVVHAVEVARGLGSKIRIVGDWLQVSPAESGPRSSFEVGESGTLARLTTALIALGGESAEPSQVMGSGTLRVRRSDALFEALQVAGVEIEAEGDAPSGWPCRVRPAKAPERLMLRSPCSSQEVTALLFALARRPGLRELRVDGEIPSRPYVDLSLRTLQSFGVKVEEPQPGQFVLQGQLRAPEGVLVLEPDASSAAVALAAGCLAGRTVRIPGLTSRSLQGDVAILEHLAAFGCHVSKGGPLQACGFPVHGARLDLARTPDLAPVLAAVGMALALRASERSLSQAEMTTRLVGLETLPLKECSRIEVLARMASELGVEVKHDQRSLELRPGALRSDLGYRSILLETAGDHRMVFAAALLSLVVPGITVTTPQAVDKSWPGFWEALARLS